MKKSTKIGCPSVRAQKAATKIHQKKVLAKFDLSYYLVKLEQSFI